MSKIAYLVHGFNVKDGGRRTIDKLRPFFEYAGWTVRDIDYRWTGLFGVRLCDQKIARAISTLIEPGAIGVGHSNGCAVLHYAAHYGAPFSAFTYINPALDRTALLASQVDRCFVWHSPSDVPVSLARLLPRHIWGAMGAVGYTGKDPRYHNRDKENDYPVSSSSHSDMFETSRLAYFAPLIVKEQERDSGAS